MKRSPIYLFFRITWHTFFLIAKLPVKSIQKSELMLYPSHASFNEKYVVTRELTSGSFGPSYIVHPKDGNEILVCKVCHKSFLGLPEKVQSFLERINRLNCLNLPFIVPFIDIIETNDEVYLIRNHVDFGSLTDFSNLTPNVKDETLVHIWKLLVERFLILHQHRIFPSSVKPSNIFIDTENSLLITDLYELTTDISWAVQTPDPFHLGFLAPEFFNRASEPSWSSDVWSLGVIIVFLKFKKLPWTTKNICTMINMITSAQLDVTLDENSDVSNIIRAVLVLDANKRPSTDMLSDLKRLKSLAKREKRVIPIPKPRFNNSARQVLKNVNPLPESVFLRYGMPNSDRSLRKGVSNYNTSSSSSVCVIRCRFINSSSGNELPK